MGVPPCTISVRVKISFFFVSILLFTLLASVVNVNALTFQASVTVYTFESTSKTNHNVNQIQVFLFEGIVRANHLVNQVTIYLFDSIKKTMHLANQITVYLFEKVGKTNHFVSQITVPAFEGILRVIKSKAFEISVYLFDSLSQAKLLASQITISLFESVSRYAQIITYTINVNLFDRLELLSKKITYEIAVPLFEGITRVMTAPKFMAEIAVHTFEGLIGIYIPPPGGGGTTTPPPPPVEIPEYLGNLLIVVFMLAVGVGLATWLKLGFTAGLAISAVLLALAAAKGYLGALTWIVPLIIISIVAIVFMGRRE